MNRSPDLAGNMKQRAQDTYDDAKEVAGQKYDEYKNQAGAKYEDMRDRANAKIERDLKPSLGLGEDKETGIPVEPQGQDPEIDNLATVRVIQNIAEEEQSIGNRASGAVRNAAGNLAEKVEEGAQNVKRRVQSE